MTVERRRARLGHKGLAQKVESGWPSGSRVQGHRWGVLDQSEKEAVPALIEQWEEKSPLMVAALSKPGVHEANAKSDSQPQ
jgi:hypothetical protein